MSVPPTPAMPSWSVHDDIIDLSTMIHSSRQRGMYALNLPTLSSSSCMAAPRRDVDFVTETYRGRFSSLLLLLSCRKAAGSCLVMVSKMWKMKTKVVQLSHELSRFFEILSGRLLDAFLPRTFKSTYALVLNRSRALPRPPSKGGSFERNFTRNTAKTFEKKHENYR